MARPASFTSRICPKSCSPRSPPRYEERRRSKFVNKSEADLARLPAAVAPQLYHAGISTADSGFYPIGNNKTRDRMAPLGLTQRDANGIVGCRRCKGRIGTLCEQR